jgi:hypothetical protein
MANLNQRLKALEASRLPRVQTPSPELEADAIMVANYFKSLGANFEVSPPEHFTERQLALVRAHQKFDRFC